MTLKCQIKSIYASLYADRASLIVQLVKNLPLQETQVRFLVWEDPLEKEMATHSSILAWRNPWTEEPGRLQSIRSQESNTTEQLSTARNMHVYVRLNLFAVHLELSQHCLLISYTPVQNKKFSFFFFLN